MRSTGSDRFDDVDGYAAFLDVALERDYGPEQRTLFAAALAERWSLAYEAYVQAGHGGDAAVLQGALDAIWSHIRGQRATAPDLERWQQKVSEVAPGADDPAARAARSACEIARLALACCTGAANAAPARQAALVAYEAVVEPVPGYPSDPKSKKQVWRQPAVQAEIERQRSVLTWVSFPVVNEHVIDFVRRESRAGTVQPASTRFTLAMGPSEPGQPPSLLTLEMGGTRPGTPAGEPPDALDAILRGSQGGSTPEQLRHLGALAGEMKDITPAAGQLSDLFNRLASLWQGLQAGHLPDELVDALRTKMEQSTSKAEKEHQNLLETTLSRWTAAQRVAYTAALAERWLLAYEAFSAEEGWGQPDRLRRILDTVWDHLRGRKLKPARLASYSQQVIENAPDTEDFDAPLALAACEILDRALECCKTADNTGEAVSAALAACSCYAMMGQGSDYEVGDLEAEERLWQQPTVREEIAWQVALLEEIGSLAQFDSETIEALRRRARL